MKYTNKKWDHAVGSDAYRDNWERIFGKKGPEPVPDEEFEDDEADASREEA